MQNGMYFLVSCFLLKPTRVAPLTIYRKWLHNMPIKHLLFFQELFILRKAGQHDWNYWFPLDFKNH